MTRVARAGGVGVASIRLGGVGVASVLLAGSFLLAVPCQGEEPAASPAKRSVEASEAPAAVVARFHALLASGNRDAALALLSPDLVVFEDGKAEMSREEYARQHLAHDATFAAEVTREVLRRWERVGEHEAWVISRVAVRGRYRGRSIDRRLLESILLEKKGGAWKITHIHWSAAHG